MPGADAAAIRYDVCLSFAADQRPYVQQVAVLLRDAGLRVFYDDFASHDLWGRDLVAYLDEIYRERSACCVMFLSAAYARRAWPNHERRSAQARAFRTGDGYLLPVRCDDTAVPGVLDTVGHLDARRLTPDALVGLLLRKLGGGQSESQPESRPEPDRQPPPARNAPEPDPARFRVGGDYIAGDKHGGDTIVSGGKHVYGPPDQSGRSAPYG